MGILFLILMQSLRNAYNKRSHNRPLRGLDLNRYEGFGLCFERLYV